VHSFSVRVGRDSGPVLQQRRIVADAKPHAAALLHSPLDDSDEFVFRWNLVGHGDLFQLTPRKFQVNLTSCIEP
jgi:hypothetical protein